MSIVNLANATWNANLGYPVKQYQFRYLPNPILQGLSPRRSTLRFVILLTQSTVTGRPCTRASDLILTLGEPHCISRHPHRFQTTALKREGPPIDLAPPGCEQEVP